MSAPQARKIGALIKNLRCELWKTDRACVALVTACGQCANLLH